MKRRLIIPLIASSLLLTSCEMSETEYNIFMGVLAIATIALAIEAAKTQKEIDELCKDPALAEQCKDIDRDRNRNIYPYY